MRLSQGLIDLVVSHMVSMASPKQVVAMVAHHNSIHEFMRIFNRKEEVAKKPVYCWCAAIEL